MGARRREVEVLSQTAGRKTSEVEAAATANAFLPCRQMMCVKKATQVADCRCRLVALARRPRQNRGA